MTKEKMFFSANIFQSNFDILFQAVFHQRDCNPQMLQHSQM